MYLLTAVLRMTVLAHKHWLCAMCIFKMNLSLVDIRVLWFSPVAQDSQQFWGNVLKSCGSLECFCWDVSLFLSSLEMANQDVNTWKRTKTDYPQGASRGSMSGPIDTDFWTSGVQNNKTIYLCYLKAPRLWCFITEALGNWLGWLLFSAVHWPLCSQKVTGVAPKQAAHRSGSLGLLRWLIWAPALSAHISEFFLDPQNVDSLSSNFISLSLLGSYLLGNLMTLPVSVTAFLFSLLTPFSPVKPVGLNFLPLLPLEGPGFTSWNSKILI